MSISGQSGGLFVSPLSLSAEPLSSFGRSTTSKLVRQKKKKGGEGEDDRKRGIGTIYGKGQKNLRGTDVSGRKGFAAYL